MYRAGDMVKLLKDNLIEEYGAEFGKVKGMYVGVPFSMNEVTILEHNGKEFLVYTKDTQLHAPAKINWRDEIGM